MTTLSDEIRRLKAEMTDGPWHGSGDVDARFIVGIGDLLLIRRNSGNDNRYVALTCFDAMGESWPVRTSLAERTANAAVIALADKLPDLVLLLQQCADEARNWVEEAYKYTKHYDSEHSRYERDIEPVNAADALLAEIAARLKVTI